MKLTMLVLALSSCAVLAATEEQTNKTFQVTSGGTLVVDVDFGSINVITNSTDAVVVNVWRKVTRSSVDKEHTFLSENPVVFMQEGNTVTVRCRPTIKEKFHWFGGFENRNEAKYTIQVPVQFNARLNTSGGGITVSNLTGEVKADTSGGGLRFAQIQGPLTGDTSGGGIYVTDCSGPIKIHTSGGGIDVTGGSGSLDGDTSGGAIAVKSFKGPVSVETSGGGITIENVAGQVKGDTSGGSILAVLLSPLPGDVSLSTSGGGVTVKVPADVAFNLDAETSGGGVRCDLPVTVQGKPENDRIKGPVNGGGPVLRLGSSGGGIHVQKL
jgi:Putative adhesin